MTTNAALQHAAVDHAIDLRRYSNSVLFKLIALLNRADAELMAELAQALMRLERDSFTVERLEAQLAAVRAINARAYDAVFRELEADAQRLGAVEARAQAAAFRRAIPAAVQLQFPIAGLSAEAAVAAALARPFQGRLLKGWAASVPESRLVLIRNAVRQGVVQGQTTAQIIQTIRGTKALNYADGLLDRPRRELATVAQTALSHVAQRVRASFYAANADLVKAVQWVATLDNRTTPECAARDGHLYDADSHAPLDGGPPWLGGPGALHFNCRSVDVPVLKSWRELGIPADELPAATRASMDGQVPADLTYAEWFGQQSAARQDEIVGPERGRLFRAGKVTFDQFTDDKGRRLTLDQLNARAG